MGFHRRYITNNQVIDLFKSAGISEVIKLYTSGADVMIADAGISSDILHAIINGGDIEESILSIIQKELEHKE
jgi:hypothetical protein